MEREHVLHTHKHTHPIRIYGQRGRRFLLLSERKATKDDDGVGGGVGASKGNGR